MTMILATEPKVTTEILWKAAIIFALIDVIFVGFLARKVKSSKFYQIKWKLVITTSLFWFMIWILMSSLFWDSVYQYVFPSWARWLIPPFYGMMFGAIGLLFWWLAIRLPGNKVLNFCVLGGLLGMITHIWAIEQGILNKPPMLIGASPIAATILPVFEFIFYWCIIITVTLVADALMSVRFRRRINSNEPQNENV
jgi:hypothetical protein